MSISSHDTVPSKYNIYLSRLLEKCVCVCITLVNVAVTHDMIRFSKTNSTHPLNENSTCQLRVLSDPLTRYPPGIVHESVMTHTAAASHTLYGVLATSHVLIKPKMYWLITDLYHRFCLSLEVFVNSFHSYILGVY